MKLEQLDHAIAEADRFVQFARRAKDRLKSDKYASISGSKETAAAKRASMDLSRALAELRRR